MDNVEIDIEYESVDEAVGVPTQPPPRRSRFRRLMEQRGHEPERIHPAIANTSLAPPPSHPADELTPYQQGVLRQQRLARGRAREERGADARRRTEERRERRVVEEMRQEADELGEALNNHYLTLAPLELALNSASARFIQEVQSDESKMETLLEFEEHCKRAAVVAKSAVRRFEIMTWFRKGMPEYLSSALMSLIDYFRSEANLRYDLHKAEIMSKRFDHRGCGDHDPCNRDEEFWTRYNMPKFGHDMVVSEDGFSDYKRNITSTTDLHYLRTSFEVRKTWMIHAPTTLRFGFQGTDDEAMERCLDNRMSRFCSKASQYLSKKRIMKDLYTQARLYGIDKATATTSTMQQFQRLDKDRKKLRRMIQTYHNSISSRTMLVRQVTARIADVKSYYNAYRDFSASMTADEALIIARDYRYVLAYGVEIDEDDVVLPDESIAEIVTAAYEEVQRAIQAGTYKPPHVPPTYSGGLRAGDLQMSVVEVEEFARNPRALMRTFQPVRRASSSSSSAGDSWDQSEEEDEKDESEVESI